jgi:hypothetical protein
MAKLPNQEGWYARGVEYARFKMMRCLAGVMPGLLAAGAVALASMAGGCSGARWKPTWYDGPLGQDEVGEANLPEAAAVVAGYAPTRLVVHRLSRLERGEGGVVRVLVHVELIDQAGHGCRWPGWMELTLETGLPGGDKVIAQDLRDAEVNGRVFDAVTRTYVLIRELEAGQATPIRARVRFVFAGADGRRLQLEGQGPIQP